MLTKIDWLSFSVMLPDYVCADERDTEQAFLDGLTLVNPYLVGMLDLSAKWSRSKGRAPYSIAWQHPSGGITVFYHPRLPHALVEISGKGCDMLAALDLQSAVLQAVQSRVTRIDIACDMLTDTRPTEFAENRVDGRFRSNSKVISESGETYYVGSRTSNRYARVYRYNPPHERSAFLRVEYVLKAEDAKALAFSLYSSDVRSIAATLGDKFGWLHPDWLPEACDKAEIKAYRAERHEGKTLFWLGDTVAPLLARLHGDGVIDARRWFADNVMPLLGEDGSLSQPPTHR